MSDPDVTIKQSELTALRDAGNKIREFKEWTKDEGSRHSEAWEDFILDSNDKDMEDIIDKEYETIRKVLSDGGYKLPSIGGHLLRLTLMGFKLDCAGNYSDLTSEDSDCEIDILEAHPREEL